MCISFNKVSSVQLIYHESRYTYVKAIDMTHPTDMNIQLNYSAVMKCQNNFKFRQGHKLQQFCSKIYTKFIEFTI